MVCFTSSTDGIKDQSILLSLLVVEIVGFLVSTILGTRDVVVVVEQATAPMV